MTDERLALAFLGTFESLRMGPTFARGRRDERAGHVQQLTISGSLVVALVRGPDDPRAFRSRIAVRSFGASEWARVEQDLAASAHYAASLLAGRMPPGMAEVFRAAGLSLVPLSLDEVAMDCTCEQWPMPCTHLAATCYALARSFEEDPFGVFAWRGRTRDELLLHLRELRSATAFEPMARGRAGGLPPDGVALAGQAAADLDAGGSPSVASAYSDGGSGSPTAGRAADGSAGVGGGPAGAGGDPAGVGGRSAGVGGDPARVDGGGVGGDGPHDVDAGFVDGGSAGGEGRGGGGSGVDDDDGGRGELEDFGDFWGENAVPAAPVGGRPGSALRPDALLDQLDPPPLAHDGRPIVDVLRPAYRALPEE